MRLLVVSVAERLKRKAGTRKVLGSIPVVGTRLTHVAPANLPVHPFGVGK